MYKPNYLQTFLSEQTQNTHIWSRIWVYSLIVEGRLPGGQPPPWVGEQISVPTTGFNSADQASALARLQKGLRKIQKHSFTQEGHQPPGQAVDSAYDHQGPSSQEICSSTSLGSRFGQKAPNCN